jgi:hypothetical protein
MLQSAYLIPKALACFLPYIITGTAAGGLISHGVGACRPRPLESSDFQHPEAKEIT